MGADDTAGSGDRSEGEKETDMKVPSSEDAEEQGDVGMALSASEALSPSEGPPEEAKETRKWKWAVIFLCFFGFMASIKPGEPFITPYLLSSEKNFTREQVSGVFRLKCVCMGIICHMWITLYSDTKANKQITVVFSIRIICRRLSYLRV